MNCWIVVEMKIKGKCVILRLAKTFRGIFVCSSQNVLSQTD